MTRDPAERLAAIELRGKFIMDTTHLPPDFKEFIQYINSEKIEYLLVGGYAVGIHGGARFTADMDIWVKCDQANAPSSAERWRSSVLAIRKLPRVYS